MPRNEDFHAEMTRGSLSRDIKMRNPAQKHYYTLLCECPLVFADGPAGTGKTFLACHRAIELLARKDVNRIILVRPCVVAEEELGFLPGDIKEKVDPFLMPLYENLSAALREPEHMQLLEKYLEVAPLAYMRGRTFNNCVVLVDEAQNMTKEQMLMLLTRLGHKCYCFVMGDPEQHDLMTDTCGLTHAIDRMRACDELVGVAEFGVGDVVRSKLAQAVYRYWYTDEDNERRQA